MTMKKTLLLLLALPLSFAVSACSNSSEANFEVTDVAFSYGKPNELAKEEFETAEYLIRHAVRIKLLFERPRKRV